MIHLLHVAAGLVILIPWTVIAPTLGAVVWMPHVPILIGVHAAMQRSAFHGVVALLVLGLIAGLLSGGPRGLYLLASLPAIAVARFARTRLQAEGTGLQAATVVPAVILCELLFAAGMLLFRADVALLPAVVRVVPASALLTGMLALPVIALLRRILPHGGAGRRSGLG